MRRDLGNMTEEQVVALVKYCISIPMQSLNACLVAVEQSCYPSAAVCINTETGERRTQRAKE